MSTIGTANSRHANKNEQAIKPRGRQTRNVALQHERRRRKKGSLNRLAQFKVDIFSEDQLDPRYIYRWVNDEGSRLRMITKQDDYDFVRAEEIPNFSPDDETDSEGSGGRLRIIVGEKKNGSPMYQYLVKKRRDFWEDDNREAMDIRDAVLDGRVYQGEINDVEIGLPDDDKVTSRAVGGLDEEEFYVPPEARLEHGVSAGRRRGPVQPPA